MTPFPIAFAPLLLLMGIVTAHAQHVEVTTAQAAPPQAAAPQRDLAPMIASGKDTVQSYFGKPFPRRFDVRIFDSRAALTEFWRTAWNEPGLKPQCWMVASGTGSTLALLHPDAWAKEACEHDARDADALQKLIVHELTHVFHGQNNPSPEFDGLDDIGWFVEGLAVLASGQLDARRLAQARTAMEKRGGPPPLSQVWSGSAKYGLAGSLVALVERSHGRAKLNQLMQARTQEEILKMLGQTEDELLAAWKKDLLARP